MHVRLRRYSGAAFRGPPAGREIYLNIIQRMNDAPVSCVGACD
jgi:hypothetical protein